MGMLKIKDNVDLKYLIYISPLDDTTKMFRKINYLQNQPGTKFLRMVFYELPVDIPRHIILIVSLGCLRKNTNTFNTTS